MRRLQLFEILDLAGCPRSVRDGATDCLESIFSVRDVYRPVRERMLTAIRRCGAERIVDLCSGGGGPWLSPGWSCFIENEPRLQLAFTDKFPSGVLRERLRNASHLTSIQTPVDAANVPEELKGFRTIFSSFHHFSDPMASKVLGDAVQSGEGFASAEVTSRSVRAVMTMFLVPLLALLLTPGIRPFRWSRLLFTYLVPAIPLVLFWDGVISCLRTRTPEELLALANAFPAYEWTAGYGEGSWLPPVYLIGLPRAPAPGGLRGGSGS